MWWLILGLIIGVGGWWLVSWTRSRKIAVKWYEWLLAALAVIFALLGIQNYFAFLREMEPNAAGVMLAVLGIPGLVLAGITVFLVWWRGRSSHAVAPSKS